MSRPSKVIFPAVGSSSRVSSRAVVLLPQPDSPTIENVSPRRTAKFTPSTACTAPTWRRSSPPRIGKCLIKSSTMIRSEFCSASGAAGLRVGAVIASAQSRAPRSARARSGRGGRRRCGRVRRERARAYLLAEALVSCGVLTARMERTAGRHIDQAGRRALDRQQPLAPRPSKRGTDPSSPQV